MRTKRGFLLFFGFLFLGPALRADDAVWTVTVLPNASMRFRGEGQTNPQTMGYVDRYEGSLSAVYRLELSQPAKPDGYWSAVLWHAGVFGASLSGGGLDHHFGREYVPNNQTGGLYQQDQLNVGFDNLFIVYHHALANLPVELQMQGSVVRLINHRKNFVVQGQDEGGTDDVQQESADGFGFGLSGQHGGRYYFRWKASANYYIQLYDALTDSGAGHIFQGEGGVGMRLTPGLSVEAGALRQYWFLQAQGDRRIAFPGTSGNIVSWNRIETRTGGYYLRIQYGL